MKKEDLFGNLNDIDEKYIKLADTYMTTNDEKSVNTVLSFDNNGAIIIKYSDDEGVED